MGIDGKYRHLVRPTEFAKMDLARDVQTNLRIASKVPCYRMNMIASMPVIDMVMV